jgi:hypothetical protein
MLIGGGTHRWEWVKLEASVCADSQDIVLTVIVSKFRQFNETNPLSYQPCP